MFNLIKNLPSWAIILVGIFFAYGNLTETEYWIKWKYVWPFLVIIFGIWKFRNELKEKKKKFKCLCCGALTFDYEPNGSYEICNMCGWEDDLVQLKKPEFSGGANELSLKECREKIKNKNKKYEKRM